MAKGRKRGGDRFGHMATPEAKRPPSAKEQHRASVHGRAAQGMGSGGKPGGTKSAGGKGGRVQGGLRGGDRGGLKSGGGKMSPKKPHGGGRGGRAP